MPAPRPLNVVFYCSASGNEPVRDWLKDLPADERRIIGEDIKTVQYRWPLGMPLVDSLGDGLWEVRTRLPSRIARTLFIVHQEDDRSPAWLHQKDPTHPNGGQGASPETKTCLHPKQPKLKTLIVAAASTASLLKKASLKKSRPSPSSAPSH